jgi:hypothetical protein
LRRAALRIARKEDCQNGCFSVAEQALNRNNGGTQFDSRRWSERWGSGNARNRVGKERTRRTETRFLVLLCLRFVRASDRTPVRPLFPAACGNIALRVIDRQRRKKRSRTKKQNKQSCEYAAQRVLREFHCRLDSPTIVIMFSSASRLFHKLLRSTLEPFLVVSRAEVVGIAFIDRFRSGRRINIHITYGTDGMPIG